MSAIAKYARSAARSARSRARAAGRRWHGYDDNAFAATCQEARQAGAEASDLGRLVLAHRGRLVTKWVHYFDAYDCELRPYRDVLLASANRHRSLRILEIGIYHGGSLQLWRSYFGESASIWGVDINPKCASIDDKDLNVRIGSQCDRNFLEAVVEEMGGVDIIVDDGSHIAAHQSASFEVLFPLLSEGGLYVVEDVHTSYWRDYGGGYERQTSFIELSKRMVDDMHTWYHHRGARLPIDAATSVSRITFYDSIVFIHKTRRARPMNVSVGSKSF